MALPLETGPSGETRGRAEDREAGASHGFLAPTAGAHRQDGRATGRTDVAAPSKALPSHTWKGLVAFCPTWKLPPGRHAVSGAAPA
jgi:hypothetical protein